MTDRLKGFIVTFAEDIRDDDAEALLGLLRQSSWVVSVDPMVSGPEDHMARQRVQHELKEQIWNWYKSLE